MSKNAEQDDRANRPQLGFAGEFKLFSITNMPEPCAAHSGRQLIFTLEKGEWFFPIYH